MLLSLQLGQQASSRIVADVLSADNGTDDAGANLNVLTANLEKINSYKDSLQQIHEERLFCCYYNYYSIRFVHIYWYIFYIIMYCHY